MQTFKWRTPQHSLGVVSRAPMPANALPRPMPCEEVEGCPLNGPCYSRVDQLLSLEQPSTSLHQQIAFITDDFFQLEGSYKGSEFEYCLSNYPRRQEPCIESDTFCDGCREEGDNEEGYDEEGDNEEGSNEEGNNEELTRDLKWRLLVYPRATDDNGNQHVGVFLRLQKCPHQHIMASFRFSWINEDDAVVHFVESQGPCLFYEGKDLGFAHFIERAAVLETMRGYGEEFGNNDEGCSNSVDGNLRILCQVKIESATEVPDIKKMGRFAYEKCGKGRPMKEPLLYII